MGRPSRGCRNEGRGGAPPARPLDPHRSAGPGERVGTAAPSRSQGPRAAGRGVAARPRRGLIARSFGWIGRAGLVPSAAMVGVARIATVSSDKT
ncbi:hypothetical protein M446_1267 [Methylobacterium sp. 4-46]|nr:hypothetical protein M446_1267 [Methylobacterium sp. 4-46]